MSAGTRIYPFRLPADLMEDVEWTVEMRNLNSADEPWTLSEFVRIALREKVNKMIRSRRPHRRNRPVQKG